MKALILNSGVGRRLGKHTQTRPKALVPLYNGESIFSRQIRILHDMGIDEFVVTTGPFASMLEEAATAFIRCGCTFDFVHNPDYDSTNAIYSMFLAAESVSGDDVVVLHGDLVFNRPFARDFLNDKRMALAAITSIQQSNKDFKARVEDGCIREVSVGLDASLFNALQPIYKLDSSSMEVWLNSVKNFAGRDFRNIYAEDALNAVLDVINLEPFDYGEYFLSEVDDPIDLEFVSREIGMIDWNDQPIYVVSRDGEVKGAKGMISNDARILSVPHLIESFGKSRPLVISGPHVQKSVPSAFLDYGSNAVLFHDYASNPTLNDVERATSIFKRCGCDSLVSVGGGSAIDVAKAVKDNITRGNESAFNCSVVYPPHIAIPTTAGTGSESTHFAVVYEDCVKTSISAAKLLPDCAVLCPDLLGSLPIFQKKCTLLDALCHAIESIWSKRSTPLSQRYACEAIELIVRNYRGYLSNDAIAMSEMMWASNLAGKAINLTTTTAAHALSYKLTTAFDMPHGLAVACCLPAVWKMTIKKSRELSTSNSSILQNKLELISQTMLMKNQVDESEGLRSFESLFLDLFPSVKECLLQESVVSTLVGDVNMERLSNHPVGFSREDMFLIYKSIICPSEIIPSHKMTFL